MCFFFPLFDLSLFNMCMYVHVYIHIYMYTLQVKTNYSVGILRQGGKSGLCLYRETLQNRDKGKDLGWGGGGGRIRRPRAGGFGAFSSAVTSPSSQQSSLQTKFTASGDGTGRAEPGRAGTGPAPRPAAPPRGSGSIRTGTELLLVELWLSKNNDRNCFLVIPPSKKRGGVVVV